MDEVHYLKKRLREISQKRIAMGAGYDDLGYAGGAKPHKKHAKKHAEPKKKLHLKCKAGVHAGGAKHPKKMQAHHANDWVMFCKAFAKENNVSYRDAMMMCKGPHGLYAQWKHAK